TGQRAKGAGMMKKAFGSMRRRVGPVGLSLVAAALTATAFAAVSTAAKDDDGDKGNGNGEAQRAAPGPGGERPMLERLSDEDRQALEDFRQCMEENGAPAPPEPGQRFEGDGPPEPPSEAERTKIEQALEACEDKLPEGAGAFGPGGPGCGPPPRAGGALFQAPPPDGSDKGGQQS
ncbi:MAG: hypothetical protein M3O25_07705, partial [Actinomycetota bacterium]|nr:hypothetical protein [Actinomycetota bacterium]